MDNDICMVIDIDRCWGCNSCVVACKQELDVGVGPHPMLVVDIGPRKIESELHKDSVPVMCQHCDDPACMQVCPTGAIYRETDGTIQVRADACNACGECEQVCPFGACEVPQAAKTTVKCTLCFQRRQWGGIPSCAQHCLGRVFTITNEAERSKTIGDRYSWSFGRVVYVSSKWSSLGKGLTVSSPGDNKFL